jgi:hypothetical protein
VDAHSGAPEVESHMLSEGFLLWTARVLGLGVGVFFALFALDAFAPDRSFFQSLPDVVVHLVPALLVLTIVAVSWRREWIGACAFTALAVGYALVTRDRPDWIAAISGPLLAVGVLLFLSWFGRKAAPA